MMKNAFAQYSCDPAAVAIRKLRRLEMDLKNKSFSPRGKESLENQVMALREQIATASNYNHWI